MLIQRLWRKKAFVVVAMVFILTLFAFNLDALVRGKVEVNKAEAWKFWKLGLHHWVDDPDTGRRYCEGNGITCIILDI